MNHNQTHPGHHTAHKAHKAHKEHKAHKAPGLSNRYKSAVNYGGSKLESVVAYPFDVLKKVSPKRMDYLMNRPRAIVRTTTRTIKKVPNTSKKIAGLTGSAIKAGMSPLKLLGVDLMGLLKDMKNAPPQKPGPKKKKKPASLKKRATPRGKSPYALV